MNTSKKVDSKGLDSLAVKLKDANFDETEVARRNEEGASRSSASDKNPLEKRLNDSKG